MWRTPENCGILETFLEIDEGLKKDRPSRRSLVSRGLRFWLFQFGSVSVRFFTQNRDFGSISVFPETYLPIEVIEGIMYMCKHPCLE